MRMKTISAAIAASALSLASVPAAAQNASASLSVVDRASASTEAESDMFDSGLMGFLIVFGAGAVVGALLYSLIKGGDEETPASP